MLFCRALRLAPREASCESPPKLSIDLPSDQLDHDADFFFPFSQDYFKNDTLALIGYGSQGHGQGLNLRDNGLNVIIGVRKNGKSWTDAQQDGLVPGKNLFDVDEAISRGTIIMNLLSDAAQSETWPAIKPQLVEGKVSCRK
jgi:ketol-acid reductoisomerase